MIFQTISLPPCLSTMTWTELAGSIAAVGLNNDATEKPVVPKEEETPVDNAKLLGICSLPWDKQCCWDLPHGSRS